MYQHLMKYIQSESSPDQNTDLRPATVVDIKCRSQLTDAICCSTRGTFTQDRVRDFNKK